MRVISLSKRKKQLAALQLDLPEDEIFTGNDIRRDKRFDSDGCLLLDMQTCIDEGLRDGTEISDSQLEKIIALSDFNRAKSKALWLLGTRSYGFSEMVSKLKLDFGPAAAREATERMADLGLIDDSVYAAELARKLIEVKKVSARDAVYKITAKGIDRETAARAVDALAPDAAEQIAELLETKFSRSLSDEKGVRRTVAALARRGFSYSDIRLAMKKYTSNDCYDE